MSSYHAVRVRRGSPGLERAQGVRYPDGAFGRISSPSCYQIRNSSIPGLTNPAVGTRRVRVASKSLYVVNERRSAIQRRVRARLSSRLPVVDSRSMIRLIIPILYAKTYDVNNFFK